MKKIVTLVVIVFSGDHAYTKIDHQNQKQHRTHGQK